MKKETESKELPDRSVELLLRYRRLEAYILAGSGSLTKVWLTSIVHIKRVWYFHFVVSLNSFPHSSWSQIIP